MIVTNARYSDHAIRYGACRGLLQIGWSFPPNQGLDNMIVEKKLHPLSCLKGLRVEDRLRLADFGFVFIRQLLAEDELALARRTGLRREVMREILEKARSSAETLEYF